MQFVKRDVVPLDQHLPTPAQDRYADQVDAIARRGVVARTATLHGCLEPSICIISTVETCRLGRVVRFTPLAGTDRYEHALAYA
jgi:hypothetical protein